jgi:IclR family transcriptional regulator, KDG regulon repressor
MDSTNKVIEILDAFLKVEGGITISELAELTSIKASTVHRITSVLVKRGYIDQQQKRGRYFLSNKKLVDFSGIARRRLNIKNIATPYLETLSKTVDEFVLLVICLGRKIYNLDAINFNPTHVLRVASETAAYDLYNTSTGKIFLAYMSDRELQGYIQETALKPLTPNTITSVQKLKKELIKVRNEGVAYDDGEWELGLRSIAAPIMDQEGKVIATICVLGPPHRIPQKRMIELAITVKKCAMDIMFAMGYHKENIVSKQCA